MRQAVRLESSAKKPVNASKLRAEDCPDGNVEQSVTVSSNEEPIDISRESSSTEDRNLLDVVSFRQQDIVKNHHSPEKRYDTILW